MKVHIHTDFEKDEEAFMFDDTNERIREFAEWSSKKLPDNVAAVNITITRTGYTVMPIENHIKEEEENEINN